MKVTREKVFETNSSSTHSICIAGGEYAPKSFRLDDGVCEVYPGEFGWEVAEFCSPEIKASYCLTYAKMFDDNARELRMLTDVLMAAGCERVEFIPNTGEFYEWGYIDHQSSDVCGRAFESKDALRDFIFNPQSILRTDNDNR